MERPAEHEAVSPRAGNLFPRRISGAVAVALTLCLLVTGGVAIVARDADRQAAEGRFAAKAERFFTALSHAIETRLELLHHISLLIEVAPRTGAGLPTLPLHPRFGADTADDMGDAFRSLYWHPVGAAPPPPAVADLRPSTDIPTARLADFAGAMAAAARPGAVGFVGSPDGVELLVALHLPAPDRPDAPLGYLLASLSVADLVDHGRQLAGLEAEVAAVDHPGSATGIEGVRRRPDGGLVVNRHLRLLGTTWSASVASDGPLSPWWRGQMLTTVLAGGGAITLAVLLVVSRIVRHARAAADAHHRQIERMAEVTGALKRVESDARVAWRMLKDENFIDGYALWDEEDRLVDYSGFLARYLPELAGWVRPKASEVVRALVDGGHVVLPAGSDVEEAVSRMCMMRREVPGLREMEMADGEVFMARTVALGDNRHACLFTNVTQLRARERETRAAEALFRTTFESGPLMMVLLDGDEKPVAVNRAFTSSLGYSLDRFVELGWRGILHPDDVAPGGAGDGTPPWAPVVKRILAADGSVVRGQVRFTPVRDAQGNREGRLLVTIEDLTSRWEAEERIRYQASLLDQVTNAVLSVDRWGRVVYANRAAQGLFQWAGQMLQGTPVNRLLGADIAPFLASDRAEVEVEGVTWSGTRFPAQVALSRLTDDGGQVVGTVLVVADLTQRRAMDLQLMHSARLATLGEMSASIAHEFNQCLHVIRLSSEALRMDLADGALDLGRVGKRADNILSQVDRLTEMVGQMRSISRRDASEKRAFLPTSVLRSAVRMVEPLMVADGVRLEMAGDLGEASVLGHPVRLEQVLLNLLNNARDAIHDRAARTGGPTGGVVRVACETDPVAGRLAIRIQDDGTGVPDDVAHTLFEPFVTTKDESRGCGLGLPISRGIVVDMGGSLTFRNLERGAEFTVELPMAEQMPAAPSATADIGDELDGDGDDDNDVLIDGRRVLLVDDEALSVMMVAEFLERNGYVVDTAYDGLEALAKLEAEVYDVVVTDIRMPRMDGNQLIRRLEELQPGTPVIVVTGHLKEGSEAELGANVVAVLAKPFQLLDLRQHIARAEAMLHGGLPEGG
ncbi:MAG: response regulator [Pseudomonadota bacterium]